MTANGDGPPDDGPLDSEATLGAALGWMADHLVEATRPRAPLSYEQLEQELARREPDAAWGPDAYSSATDYWHWKHQWHLERIEHPERFADEHLPTDGPLLSIVVPVYRPALWYFEECVLSVLAQTYSNWELCLCDDGSGDPALTARMETFAAGDARIKALTLDRERRHLPGHQSCARRGRWRVRGAARPRRPAGAHRPGRDRQGDDRVIRCRHHLHRRGQARRDSSAPTSPTSSRTGTPTCCSRYPYLGHITAIRRAIVTRIGGFRPEFDGSQDFDLTLRATELARRIVHIPKVLYHWRVVAGSAAGDQDAKPWAYAASRRALEDAVARRGIEGTVESGPFLGAYHVRRRILGHADGERDHPLPRPGVDDRGLPPVAGGRTGLRHRRGGTR